MNDAKALEQDITATLGSLPLPIRVMPPGENASDPRYTWQCLEGKGTATSFGAALDQALHFLIGRLAGPATPGLKWFDCSSQSLKSK